MSDLVKDFIKKINGLEEDLKQFKLVANEFSETKSFLESIYAGIDTAIFVIDVTEEKDFLFAGFNPKQEKLTGLKSSWVQGKKIEELAPKIPAEICKKIKKRYENCIDGKKQMQYEEILQINGKDRYWITTLMPLKNESGRIHRIIGSANEISLIKEQQNLLKKKNEEIATQNEEYESLNEELRSLNESLEDKVAERTFELSERVKELKGLYAISTIAEKENVTIENILDEIITIIPSAWQWPEITYAKIIWNKQIFQTKNYKPTRWNIKYDLNIRGEKAGKLIVGYTEKRLSPNDTVFLDEEYDLIKGIAEQIGKLINRKMNDIELKEKNEEYHSLYEEYLAQNEELKSTNDELREKMEEIESQHKQFLSIYKNHPEIIYVADPKTYEVLFVNNHFRDMLPEDPVGKKCYKQFQGLDQPCEFCTNDILFETKQPYQWEFHNTLLDKHFFITDQLIEWTDEREVRFELAIDITESKKNEVLLGESEGRFKLLAENAQDMIYRMSLPDGRYTYVSPASKKIFGYMPDEFYNQPGLIAEIIHKDWHEYFNKAWKNIQNGIIPKTYEYQVNHKNGKTKWINQRNVAIKDDQGKLIALEGIVTDISDQKQAELDLKNKNQEYHSLYEEYLAQNEELKSTNDELREKMDKIESQHKQFLSIYKNHPEIIYVTDPKTYEVLFVNNHFRDMLPEDPVGKKCYKQFQGLDQPCEFCTNDILFETKQPYQWEFHNILLDKHFFITDQLIEWPDGRQVRFELAIDVTRQKEAEKLKENYQKELEVKVKKRTEELENVISELESFSYSVSHDLRAPLRAITGYSSIIMEDYTDKIDEEGKQYLDVIVENSNKMGHLIDDILEFSRLSRKDIRMQNLDMDALVKHVFKELITEENSIINFIFDNKLPKIAGDQTMIKLVITNLLSNAIKYSRNSNPSEIHIGGETENGHYKIYIKDNGVGFDQKYADKMFGVFQRLHNEKEFEGTGVGLAIAQRVILKHGGKIWAEGKLEQGATIYFTIPKNKTI